MSETRRWCKKVILAILIAISKTRLTILDLTAMNPALWDELHGKRKDKDSLVRRGPDTGGGMLGF